ncbi:MAG: hypothetical protein AAF351_15460 [Pseudomonadota bacterium]
MGSNFALKLYYASTAVFLLLDFAFGLNIRLAFLETSPAARLAYYGFCFGCLGLIVWRPAWTGFIGALESMITLAALILIVASRVMLVTPALEAGGAPLGLPALLNFLLAGMAAYFSYLSSLKVLRREYFK